MGFLENLIVALIIIIVTLYILYYLKKRRLEVLLAMSSFVNRPFVTLGLVDSVAKTMANKQTNNMKAAGKTRWGSSLKRGNNPLTVIDIIIALILSIILALLSAIAEKST